MDARVEKKTFLLFFLFYFFLLWEIRLRRLDAARVSGVRLSEGIEICVSVFSRVTHTGFLDSPPSSPDYYIGPVWKGHFWSIQKNDEQYSLFSF